MSDPDFSRPLLYLPRVVCMEMQFKGPIPRGEIAAKDASFFFSNSYLDTYLLLVLLLLLSALNDDRDRDDKAAENWLKFAKIIGDLSYDIIKFSLKFIPSSFH